MTPKPISDVEGRPPLGGGGPASATKTRVVIITLDPHLGAAVGRARADLAKTDPHLELSFHAASTWSDDPDSLARCRADIASGDIILACMLFMDDQIQAIRDDLVARRDHCRAMVGFISAGEVIKLTRLGKFDMSAPQSGVMGLLKRLRGSAKGKSKHGAAGQQMSMLRRLPKILRFIPGTAQDVRAYFLTLQYWLSGSDENIANLARFLAGRYAAGAASAPAPVAEPKSYPEVGLYHPDLADPLTEDLAALPGCGPDAKHRPTVGVLVMRSYLLSGDTGHYDGAIRALEARGLRVIPAFASGLDARPAIDRYFLADGGPRIDALVSLTGFSLVGGPAYNDADAAEAVLRRLDVPYFAAHALEFQSLAQWRADPRGLTPVEQTLMVAIPELDGATVPMVYGGRRTAKGPVDAETTPMDCDTERAAMLAARVAKRVAARHKPITDRRVAITLFGFPPNAGAVGTAAFLGVWESLFGVLRRLKAHGYDTGDLPADVDALRQAILVGNGDQYGTEANVMARIPTEDHVRREPHLAEIERQWGPAPGTQLSDGTGILVLGRRFGKVAVTVQPSFGYEGDPMRLLFEHGFAPTHAFSAFYRYLREDFDADAILHFGTHGALEFMPGKQAGLSDACWPDRLIGDAPNLYLYAANNPSEGTIAKRRSGATLISHLTPPLAKAGLYKGLADLKASIDRWRATPPDAAAERGRLAELIQTQGLELDLCSAYPNWTAADVDRVEKLGRDLLEVEYALIPNGLHVIGTPPPLEARIDTLAEIAEANLDLVCDRAVLQAIALGADADTACRAAPSRPDTRARDGIAALVEIARGLTGDGELQGLMRALDGRYIPPVAGGDLLRNPEIMPTGRNLHGFDPFRMPSAFALQEGRRLADLLLDRHIEDTGALPSSVALVLWGTDNLKTEGGPIGQALALLGAKPRFDSFGRLCGAELIPLDQLGRPRVDVIMTLSGIFRDLLPLQTKLLAEAAWLAASAEDEPAAQNPVRTHALAYQAETGCDFETAALRVFSNADGAYGSNVNFMVASSSFEDEDDLAEAFTSRKCFAYGRDGKPTGQPDLLKRALADVQVTYQNIESAELGVTTIDHYFDTLGGISRSVRRARGDAVPVYIGDQTKGDGKVRTLSEQVALETRTRMLNPKWVEGMLTHGYEGVRNIEAHVTNVLGWSATTGTVDPWVYQRVSETYLLDAEMRERLAALNPTASAKLVGRLLEASDRQYWQPDAATLQALRDAGDDLEDRLEGIGPASPSTNTPHVEAA